MLDQAKKLFEKNTNNVELRLGELEHLPLENNEADLAVLSMVLHHLPKPERVILETARILEKTGHLLLRILKNTNEEMRKKFGDRRLGFSAAEIRTLLENSGFMEQEIKHSFKTIHLFKHYNSEEKIMSLNGQTEKAFQDLDLS